MSKRKLNHLLYVIVKILLLGVFLIATIFPFFWMVISSFKKRNALYTIPVKYFPDPVVFDSYKKLFANSNFVTSIINSIGVSLVSAFFAILFALMAAYAISRFKFKGKRFLRYFFLVTQMIPTFIGLFTLYRMLSSWGWIDHKLTLVIMECTYMISFSVITLIGYLSASPVSLEEAAMIDGCNRISTIFHVVIPVIAPGLAAAYIFAFVQVWNDLFTPVMLMTKAENYTIPIMLNSMVAKTESNWGEISAGIVVAICPTIIMFAFCQKYIASGLTSGAVKG